MNKLIDEINWEDFNETEKQAIGIDFENMLNSTDNPTFPYSAAVFNELAENLASVALIKPNSALKMIKELNTLNKVLLEIMPTPPTKNIEELGELLTEDEVKKNLFSCNVRCFLVKQFNQIIDYMIMAQEMAGGDNGTKH